MLLIVIDSLLLIGFPFFLASVKFLVVEVRHQLIFHIVNALFKTFKESVEILSVQEDFVPLNPVILKFASTFSQGNVVVISPGLPNVNKVSSPFASTYLFGKDAVISLVPFHVANF